MKVETGMEEENVVLEEDIELEVKMEMEMEMGMEMGIDTDIISFESYKKNCKNRKKQKIAIETTASYDVGIISMDEIYKKYESK